MVEDCVFCRIIAHRTPASFVYEDGEIAIIMSLHQFNPGHALVVPKVHLETIYDLPVGLAGPMFAAAARVARAVKLEFTADGVTIRQHNEPAGGQTVPHLHIHVVPRYFGDNERHFPGLPSDGRTLDTLAALQAGVMGLMAPHQLYPKESKGMTVAPLSVYPRILLGPGPSNTPPAVQSALSAPMMGHMDPAFTAIMDSIRHMLGHVFETKNPVTIALPGGGMAGMQASFTNLLEPGDTVVIGVAGYFAGRMVSICEKLGARVIKVETEWGTAIPAEAVEKVLKREKVKAIAIVHGETSTGIEQPLDDISRIAHENGALLLVDVVASLGGVRVQADALGIDVCYGGSQKCLSAPPGVSPITVSDHALGLMRSRKTPIPSFYLDLTLLEKYWLGTPRAYHHTAPVPLMYALHEALRLSLEEGLPARYERHKKLSLALIAGVEAMGLQVLADPAHRLASVTGVRVPEGVNDGQVRRALLDEFNIEIGGGLGPLAGKLWRIGLMGYSASKTNVLLVLTALESLLARSGYRVPQGAGPAAAATAFSKDKE